MVDHSELRKAYQMMVFVVSGLILGCLFLAGIFYFLITSTPAASSPADVGYLRPLVIISSISLLIGSVFIKSMVLNNQNNLTPSKDLNNGIQRLKTATFLSLALCEGAVMFGLVVAFMGHNPTDLILPVIVGVIGFSLHFPRYNQWEQWIQN